MILSYFINSNAHKLFLKKQDKKLDNEIKKEARWVKGKRKIIVRYIVLLLFSAVMLYLIGNLLSDTLTNLCQIFMVPQFVLGIALGFITSIPELITFFESQKHYKKTDEELGVVEATNNLLTSNVANLFIIQTIGIILFSIFICTSLILLLASFFISLSKLTASILRLNSCASSPFFNLVLIESICIKIPCCLS